MSGITRAAAQPTRRTPPSFVAHALDDSIVSHKHGELFCNASRAHGVACEYVTLARGGHAFVSRPQAWRVCTAAAGEWLRRSGWCESAAAG